MQNGPATLENSFSSFSEKQTLTYYVAWKFDSRYLPKRNEWICPHRDLSVHMYSSVFHNTSKVKTTYLMSWIHQLMGGSTQFGSSIR